MNKKNHRLLFITEDFPSGLNGTSVKTRNTLNYLLDSGYKIDVCCFLFEEFSKHDFKHKNLRIFTAQSKRINKTSITFFIKLFSILFSYLPITIKRLFNADLDRIISQLQIKNKYDVIFYDGYSTLQYLDNKSKSQKIYIDDEDFTDLFRQRFFLDKRLIKKLFFLHEYLKSLFYESLYMSKVDQVWAISPRTKERLEEVSGVKTVLMPTIIPLKKNLYQGNSVRIVFTGTLNWRENVEGLKWFITNHWSRILNKIPEAELVVIGQGASPSLISYLKSQRNIVYKGYVKSLEDEYRKISLSIAPVRINAGIKVKILTYMSYGLPVVSTHKAAWGLVSTKGVLVASDNNLSRCIISLLQNNKLRRYLSLNAHNNIKSNYSQKQLEIFLSQNLNNYE